MKKTLIALSFILLTLLLIHPVDNNDIWMHIKTGELIVKDMQIPRVDEYSYTVEGEVWLNHQWLSQVFYYIFYKLSGVNGVIFLQTILIFLAFLLFFQNIYKKDNYLVPIILLILVIVFSQERYLARPLVFSLFLFSVFLFILHNYKYRWTSRKWNLLYMLIPLQILWVNLHGAAIMGVFLVWAYIVGEFIDNRVRGDFKNGFTIKGLKYKRLLYVGIILVISTGITPYGYEAILFPIKEFKEMHFIYEWLPSVHKDIFLNLMPYFRLFLLISIVLFIFKGRLIPSAHIITFLCLLYLSLGSRRHVMLYAFAVGPYITQYLKFPAFKKPPLYLKKFFIKAVSVVLILYLALLSKDIFTGEYYTKKGIFLRFGLGRMGYPDEAVDFLVNSGLDGNMFNDYGSGCFLMWRLYPHKKVFIDGRNTIYGTKFIQENYIAPLINPALFEGLVKKYDINYVFLHYALSFGNLVDVIPYLYYSKNWELVFFDDNVYIFVRNTEENFHIIDKYSVNLQERKEVVRSGKHNWQSIYPKDYINRAAFYERIGFLDMAVETLEDAVAVEPGVGDLYYNLGTLYLKKEMWSSAIPEFKKALEFNRRDADAYNNLGMAYGRLENYKDAIRQFKKALWLNPFHRKARGNIKIARNDYRRQNERNAENY